MVIKSRLAKGVWRDDKSKLVELYLEVKASVREKAAQAEQKDAAWAACRRTRKMMLVDPMAQGFAPVRAA